MHATTKQIPSIAFDAAKKKIIWSGQNWNRENEKNILWR